MIRLAVVGAAVLVLGLHLVATWAEGRGWIYYRSKDRPRPRGLGLLSQIYEPEMEHVVEELQSERVRREDDESGDRIDPGG